MHNLFLSPFRPYALSITEDCFLKVENYVALYSGRPLHYSLHLEHSISILGESIVLADQSIILSIVVVNKHPICVRSKEL
jgi:hypothetical protein